MKKHIAILSIWGLLCSFQSTWAGKDLSALENDIETLSTAIHNERTKLAGVALVGRLKEFSHQFDALKADNEIWSSFITRHNDIIKKKKMQDKSSTVGVIEIWHDQTPQQAIGAHLFFPPGIEVLRDSSYTEHLLKRNDILWSFAIAAHYQDPRGAYYISRILGGLWKDYNDPYGNKEKSYPKFFEQLASKAVKGLKLSADKDAQEANPEALMILAQEYVAISSNFTSNYNLSLSIEYLEKLESSPKASLIQRGRSKTQLLDFRRRYSETYTKKPRPTFDEHIKAAEDYSYGKVLEEGIDALRIDNSDEENMPYFEKAARNYGYSPSYLRLGALIKASDDDKAEDYFRLAGDNGISQGYIEAGLLYIGKDILGKSGAKLIDYLSDLDEGQISEAKQWFQKAINNNDFQGWDYMASLSYGLFLLEKENPNNQHQQAFRKALEEGMNLGSPFAYSWLNDAFNSQEIKGLIQKYGPAPQGDLWKDIKLFIEAKNS